jgi:hypothetical protein
VKRPLWILFSEIGKISKMHKSKVDGSRLWRELLLVKVHGVFADTLRTKAM